MKKILKARFIPAMFVFIFMLPSLSFSAQESRIALVIGNGSYKSSPLRNPVNDAKDIASSLQKLGFIVSLKTNANQRTMKESIRLFGKKLRNGGIGLFYFAGHGLQVNGSNYLIPIGAKIESESDVEYEAVDAGRVLGKMEDAGNNLNIILLDACRDNPFGRSFRSSGKGLAKMDAPTGSILAYSTAPGSVAADGTGKNGLYTSILLKYMSKPGLKVEDMFKQVRIGVMKDSGKKQVPWESSSLTGDFYFNPGRGIAVSKRPLVKNQGSPSLEREREKLERERQIAPAPNQGTFELAFWESIKNSVDPEDYQAYLDHYPDGLFAALARRRAMLKKAQVKVIQLQTTDYFWSNTDYAQATKDLHFDVGLGSSKWGYGFAGVELKKANVLVVDVAAPSSYEHYDANAFAGFIIDYHTPEGYVKRVMFGIGMLDRGRWGNDVPGWGNPEKPQHFSNIGHASTYRLDLKQQAPSNWDGKIWFTVGIQNAGRNTSIQAQLRVINDPEPTRKF